jgi:hypothetical protein
MANVINQYLKRAGIKTPYEEMTESQIKEKSKANPLGGYGYTTAQERRDAEAQRRAYEDAMNQEQAQRQQEMLMQMPAEYQIGHHATSLGLQGLGKLFGRGQEQAPQEAPPENDPEIDRYNQLVTELGDEATALEILGQETGNGAMITQAAELRKQNEEHNLNMEDKRTTIDERKKKPNTVQTFNTMIDGKPGEVDMEIIGKDADGNNIYKQVGKGLKGSVTDTAEGWSNTRGGIDQRAKAFEGALTSTANALDAYDAIMKIDTKGLGWSGKLISQADNIVSGLKNLGETLAMAEGRTIDEAVTKPIGDYDWSKLSGVAAESDKMKSLVFQLAYAQAAATGDSSRSLSDRDIQNQIDIIGGSITNAESFKKVVEQNKTLLIKKLENTGQYSKINGKPVGEAYKEDLAKLRSRVGMSTGKAKAPQVGEVRNGYRFKGGDYKDRNSWEKE